jgi:hypothetical protein
MSPTEVTGRIDPLPTTIDEVAELKVEKWSNYQRRSLPPNHRLCEESRPWC